MPELFIEFFSEEIPARMQLRAAEDLKTLAGKFFTDAGYGDVAMHSYVTPRRLVLHVPALPPQQPDRTEEIKGPRIDAPEQALAGFMQANNLASLDGIEQRVVGKGTHYFITRNEQGRDTISIVKSLTHSLQTDFSWQKSMRWGNIIEHDATSWVRPLHTLSFVFGNSSFHRNGSIYSEWIESVFFHGHRFLAPAPFTATNFADYKTKLREHFVVLDQAERRAMIAAQAEKLAVEKKLTLRADDGLLDEVTGLVEFPVAMLGSFDAAFLSVPQECLIATMRANQKYFPLFDGAGKLANHFIVIANVPGTGGNEIVAGNERVLRARLSDAKFFYEQDLKTPLENNVPKLAAIQFHAKLGTVAEKVARMRGIAERLAPLVGANVAHAARAAELCKADLVTGMVGEFPELQGLMGRYYALAAGEPTDVADAIEQHYWPVGANAAVPSAPVSIALALADKLDSLNEFFRIDEKPTGSKDPYALRRAALGIIRILVENKISLPLQHIARADVTEFIKDRLQVALRDQGIGHDCVKACLSDQDDVMLIAARAAALQNLLANDVGIALLATYRRAANILKAEEKKDGVVYNNAIQPAHLNDAAEKTLAAALPAAETAVKNALAAHDYNAAAAALAALQPQLTAFFDHVMVNADDAAIRTNRLNLLGQIRSVFHHFADFSLIEG